MLEFEHNWDTGEDIRKVMIEYSYEPGEFGERERGTGLLLTPDISSSIEVISVRDAETDEEIPLTKEDEERIEHLCQEDLGERKMNAEADRYEDR